MIETVKTGPMHDNCFEHPNFDKEKKTQVIEFVKKIINGPEEAVLIP